MTDHSRGVRRAPATVVSLGLLATLVSPAPAAAYGELTPELQAEIDRVVPADGSAPVGAAGADATRCAVFEGERYCLGFGWTTASEADVTTNLAEAAEAADAADRRTEASQPEATGDLDASAALQRRRLMTQEERTLTDRRELTAAARSVDKVRELRAEVEEGELADGTRARPGRARDYPRRSSIMKAARVREQRRWYWCGPATAQAIAWGWRRYRQPQRLWAERLGTTRGGSAITDVVRVVNARTGYDRRKHAGPYVVLDVSGWSFRQWYLLMMRHIEDYRAPVVLHPVLEKRFFPYLDDDASGHFQVGRGYDRNPGGEKLLGYFEPWNQQRFDPSEPFIARNQWQSAYQQYRANLAHPQHNVGV